MTPNDEPEEHEEHEDQDDLDETELMQVWLSEDEMRVNMDPGVFEDPSMWGTVFANLTQFIAGGLKESENKDPDEIVKLIVKAFHDELANPE